MIHGAGMTLAALRGMTRLGTAALLAGAALVAGCESSFTPQGIPTVSQFVLSPESIVPGDSASVSWRVLDADSVVLDHGIGRVAPDSGSVRVSPAATTEYTLTAYGPGGARTARATLRVWTSVPFCSESPQFAQFLACTPAAIAGDVAAAILVRTEQTLSAAPRVSFGGQPATSVSVVDEHSVLAVPPAGLSQGFLDVAVAISPGAPSVSVGTLAVTGARATAHVVPALISHDTTLSAAGGPWRLTLATSVQSGATLTIEPGAVVLVSAGGGIVVQPGGRLTAGGGATPCFLVPENGRGTLTKWGVIHLLAGSGPNALENVFCDGGGDGNAPAAVTVRGSATVLCQLAVRDSKGNGLALALEHGGTVQTGTVWSSDNGAAGIVVDDGAGETSGTLVGTVRDNGGAGVLFLNAVASTCGRWVRSALELTGNAGGAVAGCP